MGELTKQVRRLWPKFDTQLQQLIESKQVVTSLLQESFKQANL